MFEGVEINLLAVLVAAIVSIVIGFIWYSRKFLGKIWMREIGKNDEDLKSSGGTFVAMTIASLITAYVLGLFISVSNAIDIIQGITVAFWLWLGFVAAISLSNVVFEGRSWKLFLINSGYSLVSLAVMGAILSAWV